MLELVFSWYLASSCWCLALSCARSQSVEGELYLWCWWWSGVTAQAAGSIPFLLRLHGFGRTGGGQAEDAGEVTSSLLCSRSSGIFIEVCERSACTFYSQDGLVVFWLLPFPWYSVGSIWSSPVCLWAVVFAEFFSCLAFVFFFVLILVLAWLVAFCICIVHVCILHCLTCTSILVYTAMIF